MFFQEYSMCINGLSGHRETAQPLLVFTCTCYDHWPPLYGKAPRQYFSLAESFPCLEKRVWRVPTDWNQPIKFQVMPLI